MFSMNRRDIPEHLLKYFRPRRVYKPKDDAMVPHRVYDALMADGWYGRSDVIWEKPNAMPESVRDRPTCAHEHVFLLTKSPRYYYDVEAVAEPAITTGRWPGIGPQHAAARDRGEAYKDMTVRRTRNRRDVWTINTEPYSGAHFATMPEALAEVCIMAGTSERGCCPECGAPWERVTARREPVDTGAQIGGCPDRQDGGRRERDVTGAGGNVLARVRLGTDAWQSGCSCDAGKPVPCTVLDPFAGSGTTVLVADRLGRHGIGVELNEEYCEMARERCYRDAPLLAYAARGEA